MKRLIEWLWLPVNSSWEKCGSRTAPSGPVRLARVGLLWNWRACWVGVHHSKEAKRTCVNLVPFLTIWYTRPGGMLP